MLSWKKVAKGVALENFPRRIVTSVAFPGK
jgi:hypothetical protein